MTQPEPQISPVRCPVPDCHWSVHGIPDAYTTTRAAWLADHQEEEHTPAELETEEQRADRLETERDHAAGDHQYCGVTCEVEMPSDMLRNGILCRAVPGSAAMLDELLRRAAAGQPAPERPLSPDYQHPECGFHWHGRDGMNIPMRDGQPVCPRCENDRLRAELEQARAAALTPSERQFLTFALDQAFERMVSDDGFTTDDWAALEKLRTLAAAPQAGRPLPDTTETSR